MRRFAIGIVVEREEADLRRAVYRYYWTAPTGELIALDLPTSPTLVDAEKIVYIGSCRRWP